MIGPDPNEGSIDPMEPEFWQLGEAVQDKILEAGYESETVAGIAVDIHDLLQSAERVRQIISPQILEASDSNSLREALESLKFEFGHVQWHGQNATEFLAKALERIPD